MNFNYPELIPQDFHDTSRVWIYQATRRFTIPEALQIEVMLNDFTEQWNSHGVPVKGYANLFFGQFIVLMADETTTGVGGCSTDSSVRIVKQVEANFGINMFDRQMLAFIITDSIQLLPLAQLKYAFENRFIEANTPYFNNLVSTKKDLLDKWITPINESWLAAKLPKVQKAG